MSKAAESALREKAASVGREPAAYAAELLEHALSPIREFERICGPIWKEFEESGMSDDELGDLLEEIKHRLRGVKRADP